MKITFAPGGNSDSFKNEKLKFPLDLADYLNKYGLNGYEIECGRGVKINAETYKLLPKIAEENDICLSLHAPYYISLSGENEDIRLKSIGYILESALAAHKLGAKKIVVHSGSCSKMSREQALLLAADTLKKAQQTLDEDGLSDINICPETMGKINQLGTLTEVLELCKIDERFLPCVDFGHLNARTMGGIKAKQDYEAIFDEMENVLGFERTKIAHIHFSKIEYSASGEKKHLTFEDNNFGPDFKPLMEIIAERRYMPSLVCESSGTQAEDCAVMKNYYEKILTETNG